MGKSFPSSLNPLRFVIKSFSVIFVEMLYEEKLTLNMNSSTVQTYMMKIFAKTDNGQKPLAIFVKKLHHRSIYHIPLKGSLSLTYVFANCFIVHFNPFQDTVPFFTT